MGELYLDDVDKALNRQHKLGLDIYWPKGDVTEKCYPMEPMLMPHPRDEKPIANECTSAS